MPIKRQVIYRETCPKDGEIVEVDLNSMEYDLLPGKLNSTKFCWIEPAPGLKQGIIQFMTDVQLISLLTVKAMFAGVGFTLGVLVMLAFMGVTL